MDNQTDLSQVDQEQPKKPHNREPDDELTILPVDQHARDIVVKEAEQAQLHLLRMVEKEAAEISRLAVRQEIDHQLEESGYKPL